MKPTYFNEKVEAQAIYDGLISRVETSFETGATSYVCAGISLHNSGKCWLVLVESPSLHSANYRVDNSPVIEMNGYTYYMGHIVNGALPGVVTLVSKKTYDTLIVAKRIAMGSMYGLGAVNNVSTVDTPLLEEESKGPNEIGTRTSRSPSVDRSISPRPAPIQTQFANRSV